MDQKVEGFVFGDIVPEEVASSLSSAIALANGDKAPIKEEVEIVEEPKDEEIIDAQPIKTQDFNDDEKVFLDENKLPESNNISFYNQHAEELSENEVLITTLNFGIICAPKEFKIDSNCIVLVLSGEDSKGLILYPGTRFIVYTRNIEKEISSHKVFYSGINFPYEDNIFLIFHLCE